MSRALSISQHSRWPALRRSIEVALTALLLVPAAPLAGLIAIVVRLTSAGPALYRQTRCGQDGRPFVLLKFRTMCVDAEQQQAALLARNEMTPPVFKLRTDPRVTRAGAFLRRSSLDELPQLINVLKGEMALVGPRPMRQEEIGQLAPAHRRRLLVKPGITGLWQVRGRNELDVSEWLKLDLEYVDHASLWLDLKILLQTIPAVLSGRGAW
jgi:lipopolysaccharide/colanic/teichoic acid biosynthesis glycosyltransferase